MKKRRANMKIILKRFTNTAGVSWMLTYQSMLYIGTVKICGAIGLDKVLRYFQTDVEKMMARMTGMSCSWLKLVFTDLHMASMPGILVGYHHGLHKVLAQCVLPEQTHCISLPVQKSAGTMHADISLRHLVHP